MFKIHHTLSMWFQAIVLGLFLTIEYTYIKSLIGSQRKDDIEGIHQIFNSKVTFLSNHRLH